MFVCRGTLGDTLRRSGTAAPAATSVSNSSFSYTSQLARSTVKTTTSMEIGSFFAPGTSSTCRGDQVEEKRRLFKKRRAKLAAKRKEMVRN